MTSWSRTAFASRPTRRSSISAIPASPTGRTTRRISACSTSISRPEKLSNSKVFADMPKPSITDGLRCDTDGRLWCSVRLGRSERGRRALLHAGRRSARQDPHPGNCRQFVLRRPAAKQALHLRLVVALCGLHQCAGCDEAVKARRNSEWRMANRMRSIRYSPFAIRPSPHPLFLNPAEIPLIVS